jgi:hypothetical protein
VDWVYRKMGLLGFRFSNEGVFRLESRRMRMRTAEEWSSVGQFLVRWFRPFGGASLSRGLAPRCAVREMRFSFQALGMIRYS